MCRLLCKWLCLGFCLALLGAPAAAHAAEPIAGDWLYAGATVHVEETAAGVWRGVVSAGTPNGLTCVGPGTEVWHELKGSGLSYTGMASFYSYVPCAPAGRGTLVITLFSPGAGQLCATLEGHPPDCQPMTKPACQNGGDDDFDLLADMADPGCDSLTDASEGPDPRLRIAALRAYEGAPLTLPITLAPLSSRPVGLGVQLVDQTARAPGDYRYAGPPTIAIAPGAPGAALTIELPDDAEYEPTESFQVRVGDVNGALPPSPPWIQVWIYDNDRGAAVRKQREERRGKTRRGGRESASLLPCWEGASARARPKLRGAKVIRAGRCSSPRRHSRSGSEGVDRMSGGAGGNALSGLGGNDTLRGAGGADRLLGGRGDDDVYGGTGPDQIDGGDGDDDLLGGPGDDLIVEARLGDDRIDGGGGDDVIVAGHGDDHIAGGAGNDMISGGSGKDSVNCGPGVDTLFVNLNSDVRRAKGCEHVYDEPDIPQRHCGSGQGTDQGELVIGTHGSDVCRARGGDDLVEGRSGGDRLFGGFGNDELFGRKGDDSIFGEPGDDHAEGGRGADRLWGGEGDDTLIGGYGTDSLHGGPGNDTLNPGWGSRGELADCGPGNDTFVYGPGDRPVNCERIKR